MVIEPTEISLLAERRVLGELTIVMIDNGAIKHHLEMVRDDLDLMSVLSMARPLNTNAQDVGRRGGTGVVGSSARSVVCSAANTTSKSTAFRRHMSRSDTFMALNGIRGRLTEAGEDKESAARKIGSCQRRAFASSVLGGLTVSWWCCLHFPMSSNAWITERVRLSEGEERRGSDPTGDENFKRRLPSSSPSTATSFIYPFILDPSDADSGNKNYCGPREPICASEHQGCPAGHTVPNVVS